jgi:hypothetical protein
LVCEALEHLAIDAEMIDAGGVPLGESAADIDLPGARLT